MKAFSFYVLILVIMHVSLSMDISIAEESPDLYKVFANKKYGYVDINGNMVIEPISSFAREFSEGLAVMSLRRSDTGQWGVGFINKKGEVAIEPRFDYAWDFSEGMAAVRIGDDKTGKWGFINKAGEIVIQPQFNEVAIEGFVEGLAAVNIGEKYKSGFPRDRKCKWGFINKKGEFVIEPKYLTARSFSEGLAEVTRRGWYPLGITVIPVKSIYIDHKGKTVLENGLGSFSNGLVRTWDGYMDKTGKIVIKQQFKLACEFTDGMARVTLDGKKWGFINTGGEMVIEPVYAEVQYFTCGLAAVSYRPWNDDRKWGYIDKEGKMVIEPQYDTAYPFFKGLADVRYRDKDGHNHWLLINTKGETVWEWIYHRK